MKLRKDSQLAFQTACNKVQHALLYLPLIDLDTQPAACADQLPPRTPEQSSKIQPLPHLKLNSPKQSSPPNTPRQHSAPDYQFPPAKRQRVLIRSEESFASQVTLLFSYYQ